MLIFDKLKKRNEIIEKEEIRNIRDKDTSIIEMNNYMLSDVRKENLSVNCHSLSISDISKINPIAIPTVNAIKTITTKNGSAAGTTLYSLSKNKFFVVNTGMNSILEDIEKKLKYYRLSLYIYSFSTLIEILLLGNYQSQFLLIKENELNKLDKEYTNTFNDTLKYVKKNADKSLEGNVLSGLGSAGKAMGKLAEKTKIKNVDNWLNEKGDNLKQTSKNIKESFQIKLEEIKESNSKTFINQIDKLDNIYNKTKEIYFDNENIYIEM